MNLVVRPPVLPMLAKKTTSLPEGADFIFEPKWDGFRALVFRDGGDLFIQSRDEKPLRRYFPELDAPLLEALPERCVLDGEIVVVTDHGLDFEILQGRLHPAASRVEKLARETPAEIVFWDLLALGDDDLRPLPFSARRAKLLEILAGARPPVHVTPATTDRAVAEDWFARFEGAGLDGVMAKPAGGAYEPNKRAMIKVKHERTCECVVGGFRWHKNGKGTHVGSLLLGLWDDDDGALHHIGVCASFTDKKRQELVSFLAPLREGALEGHPWRGWAEAEQAGGRKPGMTSRWSAGKSLSWEPLRPELVCEVTYDHMQGTRFRHTAHFKKWRADKPPRACTFAQLDVTPPYELQKIFRHGAA